MPINNVADVANAMGSELSGAPRTPFFLVEFKLYTTQERSANGEGHVQYIEILSRHKNACATALSLVI